MEYSIGVWRPPIKEWKAVLNVLTYHRKWLPGHNCWRDVLLKQQGMAEMQAWASTLPCHENELIKKYGVTT